MGNETSGKDWLERLVGATVRHGKEEVPTSVCTGKHVAFYFSAHWCGPCKLFTPQLVSIYNKLNGTKSEFEVIYVSLDRSRDEFEVRSLFCPTVGGGDAAVMRGCPCR